MAPGTSRGPGRSSRRPGRSSAAAGPASRRPATAGRPRTPPTTRRRAPQITIRAVLLLSVVLLLVASYTSSLHAWWQQRSEIQERRAEIAMREAAIDDLEETKARWDDPAYVRQQARERFGWVMPGEVGYRVIGADGAVEGDVPTLEEPPDPEARPWYDTLWGSVEAAGRTPTASRPVADPDEVLKKK